MAALGSQDPLLRAGASKGPKAGMLHTLLHEGTLALHLGGVDLLNTLRVYLF